MLHKPRQVARAIVAVGFISAVYKWYATLKDEMRVTANKSMKLNPVFQTWMKDSRTLKEGYSPTAWLSIGRRFFVGTASTIGHAVARAIKPYPKVQFERETFKLDCGATIGLDWAHKSKEERDDETKPLVLLHHGLAGSSESHYIQAMVHKLLETNRYRVCVMVARGCGGVPLTTPYGFTASGYNDLKQVAEHLREENGEKAKIYAVGYSLAGGILANYLGRTGDECALSGAVVVSPSWDFNLMTPYFDIWSKGYLAKGLIKYAMDNEEALKQHGELDFEKLKNIKTVREFDTHAVVPVHGYSSVDHYYNDSSAIQVAQDIYVPTLALSAADDPICCVDGSLRIEQDQLHGPGLAIATTSRGGHVAWPEGLSGHESYMDRVIVEWLDACTKALS
eukprot:CAMPEP_0203763190 /NCGR_PEP_ID=MMETSP0098-20131031/15835_1 /ASSEMBLY_ACC=CAM_ASM_000208 /TAXON_ID=96639 /ORGANISM=" , Strain NY0313808BC1" /LENGTH=393 /DNA_ID=CAMNT_0050657799 /DNA_START=633 /DNA_END=1814 /DNA_ORIENTATION=+